MPKSKSLRQRPEAPRKGGVKKAGWGAIRIRQARSPSAAGVDILLEPNTYRALSSKTREIKTLIKTYGTAIETSHRTGRQVGFRIEMKPGKAPRIIPDAEPGPSDPTPASATAPQPDLDTALTAARARGQSRVAAILNADDMLSADAFAELLGTTRVTVNTRRAKRQILGLEGAKRGFRFPRWQVGRDGKPFSAIPDLFARLGGDPWAVYRFLVQHHPELDGLSGCDALRQGKTEQAIAAAESVARNPA